MKIRWRPSIMLGLVTLAVIGCLGMAWGYEEIAGMAVVGITGLLPKLVDSEEKTQNQKGE